VFDVAAKLIGVQLLDVDLLELVDCLVSESAVKVEEAGVRHFWKVRNQHALIEVGILWLNSGLEF